MHARHVRRILLRFWSSKTIAFRPRSKFRIKIIFGAVRSCGCPENQDNFFSLTERHQTERMNRTLLAILRKTANDFPKSWPQHLPSVMSSVHSTTGVTPHMAMFGREVMLPVSMLAKPPEEITAATVPFVSDLRDTLRDAHERVRQATGKAAQTKKSWYDSKSKGLTFNVGQIVWLYWPQPPVRQKYKKLQQLWTGPWRIELLRSPLVVTIKHTVTNKRQTVHMVPCADQQSSPPVSETVTQPPKSASDPIHNTIEPSSPVPGPSTQSFDDSELTQSQSQRPTRDRRIP